ncbi:hypothetical protein RIF29_09160 [Crotalaria pallida]|uniref:Transposase n=1 Tax=Crotalaria pallida TaxID=3830 RepID=A0AAN9FRN9_CROPI
MHQSIEGRTIKCPCSKCGFKKWQSREVVEEHLTCRPFPQNYKVWYLHGETSNVVESDAFDSSHVIRDTLQPQNPMETMINDAFGFVRNNVNEPSAAFEPANGEDNAAFYELLKDNNEQLYEGCTKYSKLSFLIKLYHIKCLCRMTDKSMTMILALLKDAFEFSKIPASFYEAKKIIDKLGLGCIKIPACPNDCMLYWGEDEDLEECKRCKTSKWKGGKKKDGKKKKKLAKILRYFPLKSRLQILFMCSKTAASMIWHASEANPDGLMRHPRDGQAWKTFNSRWPEFTADPRNVRLALATDGFNPFGIKSTNYSIWPVMLIPYNRPPWECMKQTSFILSMIIPGKKMPGNDIDVYFQPLMKELRELWSDGVEMYDSLKNEMFRILKHGGKWCFMGHRRFLERGHKFRVNRSSFDGEIEHRGPPIKLTGSDILKQLEGINVTFGKPIVQKELWPDENGRYCPSVFTMSNAQKDVSLRTLINVKVPDGYSSNISCCIDAKKRKFVGMKSHDCHILMEHLLPLAIRNVLPDKVTAVLIELCSFFRQLCSKTLNPLDLDKLQSRIILTLCHLEMLFPPSFFTIMVHLTCHLVDEAKLGGPVQYRWMYPVERYLGHLKSLVRNKAQPEGSIAQGYLAEEVLTFCSQYLEGIETRINRPARVNDDTSASTSHPPSLFPPMGEAVGAFSTFELSTMEKIQAHRYVLLNCPAVKPYIDEFKDHVRRRSKGRKPTATQLEKIVSKDFIDWFPRKIINPDISNNVLDDLKFLAKGPTKHARRFSAFNINGFKFRTTAREVDATTQNNGVFLTSSTSCVASGVDGNVREADLPYYGKLEDIIELNYYGKFKVTLFKCQWADTTRDWGIRKDKWGFTSINFSRLIHNGEREDHDPYIEASQAQMVYYVEDEVNKGWSVVVHVKPRDLYDMGEQDDNEVCEIEPCPEQDFDQFFGDINDLPLVREDAGEEFLSEENDINDIGEDEHNAN